MKDLILATCEERGDGDEWARQVETRIQGALSDLHATKARYHDDCRKRFMAGRKIKDSAANKLGGGLPAFAKLFNDMNGDRDKIWTSNELFEHYKRHGGDQSKRTVCSKIKSHFGDKIAWFSDWQSGLSSLLIFRDSTSNVSNLVNNDGDEDTEVDRLLKLIGKRIGNESQQVTVDHA